MIPHSSKVKEKQAEWFRQREIVELRKKVQKEMANEYIIPEDEKFEMSEEHRVRVMDRITDSLEKRLRLKIAKEMEREQRIQSNQRDGMFKEIDGSLAEDIASRTCAICFELMAPPKNAPTILFPCGHTFCRHCIYMLTQKHGKKVCPECRQKIVSKATNMPLQQIIETYLKQEKKYKEKERQQNNQKETLLIPNFTNPLDEEIRKDSFYEEYLPQIPEQDHEVAESYYRNLRKISLRKGILESELKETTYQAKIINKQFQSFDQRLSSLKCEEESIKKDIEILMKGLENIKEKRIKLANQASKHRMEQSELVEKEKMLQSSLSSLRSQESKTRILLQNYLPHNAEINI